MKVTFALSRVSSVGPALCVCVCECVSRGAKEKGCKAVRPLRLACPQRTYPLVAKLGIKSANRTEQRQSSGLSSLKARGGTNPFWLPWSGGDFHRGA